MALPMPTPVEPSTNESAYTDYVVTFYQRVGQGRPSREKLHAGVKVLRQLVEEEHYTLGDCEVVLEWITQHLQSRFRGQVQSMGLLPHVIGEALQYRRVQEQQRTTTLRRVEAQAEQEEWERERKQWEKVIASLPGTEREALHHEAVQNLLEQGLQKQFLVEGLIRLEMIQVYKRQHPAGSQHQEKSRVQGTT
jgi:hypothetical protein